MVIQYLLTAVFAAALIHTWRRARHGALAKPAALGWSALWIAGGLIVLRPETASALARFLGVGRSADVIVYLALVASFYLIFRLFVRLEAVDRHLTKLVREITLRDDKTDPHDRKE